MDKMKAILTGKTPVKVPKTKKPEAMRYGKK